MPASQDEASYDGDVSDAGEDDIEVIPDKVDNALAESLGPQVNTTPSQIEALVPKFQGPLTADYLSEPISVHEINVLFIMNV